MTSPSPVDYEVQCHCGHVLHGQRGRLARQVTCSACGGVVFILPRDCYPAYQPQERRESRRGQGKTQRDRGRRRRRRARSQSQAEAERTAVAAAHKEPTLDEILKDLDEGPDDQRKVHGGHDADAQPAAAETAKPSGTVVQSPGSKHAPTPDTARPRFDLPNPLELVRRISPVQRVMLGILFVVLLTAYWMHRQHRQEQALQQFRSSRQRGLDALSATDWGTALTEFSAAREAAAVLNLDDLQSRQVDQLWAEVQACDQMATISLFDALSELDVSRDRAADYSQELGTTLRAGWLLFDADVRLQPEGDAAVIDFPLDVDGIPVVLRTTAPVLLQIGSAEESRRSIFAAQFQACRYDTSPRRQFVVTLRPDSLVLWTSSEILEALGYLQVDDEFHPAAESLSDVLVRQTAELKLE